MWTFRLSWDFFSGGSVLNGFWTVCFSWNPESPKNSWKKLNELSWFKQVSSENMYYQIGDWPFTQDPDQMYGSILTHMKSWFLLIQLVVHGTYLTLRIRFPPQKMASFWNFPQKHPLLGRPPTGESFGADPHWENPSFFVKAFAQGTDADVQSRKGAHDSKAQSCWLPVSRWECVKVREAWVAERLWSIAI